MDKQGYVYIFASRRNGTLYIGVTSTLRQRIWQHKEKLVGGFTKKYGVDRLAYFEVHGDMYDAIVREKQVKKWRRKWKLELIEEQNPNWDDLYEQVA